MGDVLFYSNAFRSSPHKFTVKTKINSLLLFKSLFVLFFFFLSFSLRPLPEDGDSCGLTDNRASKPPECLFFSFNFYFLCPLSNLTWPFFPDPPTSLNVGESVAQRKRRTLVAPDMNLSLDQSEGSVLSDDFLETPDDLDINVDDMETPDETDSLEFINNGNDLEWEGQRNLWEHLGRICVED